MQQISTSASIPISLVVDFRLSTRFPLSSLKHPTSFAPLAESSPSFGFVGARDGFSWNAGSPTEFLSVGTTAGFRASGGGVVEVLEAALLVAVDVEPSALPVPFDGVL